MFPCQEKIKGEPRFWNMDDVIFSAVVVLLTIAIFMVFS